MLQQLHVFLGAIVVCAPPLHPLLYNVALSYIMIHIFISYLNYLLNFTAIHIVNVLQKRFKQTIWVIATQTFPRHFV